MANEPSLADYKNALDYLAIVIRDYGEAGEAYLPLFEMTRREYKQQKRKKKSLKAALERAQAIQVTDTHSDTQNEPQASFPDLRIQ